MHDKTVTDRFVKLRSSGQSFSRIAMELNVSRPTLIAWSRKFQFEIQNLRAIELEALREKWLADTTARVDALGERLREIEAEIAKRDFASVSTSRLYGMADTLRRQIEKETASAKFTCPISEIPNEEYHEQVQQWTP